MKNKKIASLFASLKVWWWVEKVQANLSIWLTDLWYDFYHILSEDIWTKNDYKWKIISLNSPFILWFWFKKILSLFVNAFKITQICKKEKIEVLIWQGDYFFMLSWLVKLLWFSWKTIAVVHTTIWIWPKQINLLLRFFLKLHDKIILISKEEYHTFLNEYKFDKSKLEIIYNSIDILKIDRLKDEKVEDINFNKFTFINIGRLTYQKWQDNLIKAFDKFNQKYNNSQLIILWDWELKEKYNNLILSLKSWNNIHLLGNKKNVYSYLSKSDCFVLSSNFEGFPIVLIETISLWIPIISTDCKTWPKELLNLDNDFFNIEKIKKTKYWYLVWLGTNTVENLFSAMEEYYLKQNISYNFLEIRNFFSIDENVNKWNNVLKNI